MIVLSLFLSISAGLFGWVFKGEAEIFSIYVVVIFFLFLPRIFYSDKQVRKVVSPRWIKELDYYAAFIILLNVPGTLYLYEINVQYDRLTHLSCAFLAFIIFTLLWLPTVKKLNFKKLLVFCFFMCILGLFLWEGVEYITDGFFGTKAFFDIGQDIVTDTTEDIFFGFFGLAFGFIYLSHNSSKVLCVLK